jgi:hypothetical protein
MGAGNGRRKTLAGACNEPLDGAAGRSRDRCIEQNLVPG